MIEMTPEQEHIEMLKYVDGIRNVHNKLMIGTRVLYKAPNAMPYEAVVTGIKDCNTDMDDIICKVGCGYKMIGIDDKHPQCLIHGSWKTRLSLIDIEFIEADEFKC